MGPVITEQDIEEERQESEGDIDDELIQQEYYLSWAGYMQGSYYGKILQRIEEQRHFGEYPGIPQLPVDTWWDLGRSDATAIWFSQSIGEKIYFIDYVEESGEGLPFYAKLVKEKPYIYGKHYFPWDLDYTEFGTGENRKDTAYQLGLRPQYISKKFRVEDGIAAVRKVLPICYFDRLGCEKGIFALQNYHKEWDEDRKCFGQNPVHDWSSHGADAFRNFGHNNIFRSRRMVGEERKVVVELGEDYAVE
jgi:phage terminase large subunit